MICIVSHTMILRSQEILKCTPLVKVYIMEYNFKVLGFGGTNSWLEWMHQDNLSNLLLHSARLIRTFFVGET